MIPPHLMPPRIVVAELRKRGDELSAAAADQLEALAEAVEAIWETDEHHNGGWGYPAGSPGARAVAVFDRLPR